MDGSVIENALVNREFVYRFLWRLFCAEPDAQLLELAASPVAAEQFGLMFEEGSAGLAAQRHLADLAAAYLADQAAGAENAAGAQNAAGAESAAGGTMLEGLRDEYTRLFLGPATPVAPLWESVHRDNDRLLFSETTLTVREAYRAAGFEASGYPKEADDHLAIELDFMAALTHRALEALAEGRADLARALCGHQRLFLEMHLNQWVPEAYERLVGDIPERFGDFYPYALALVREACDTDAQVVAACEQALLGLTSQ